MIRPWHIWAVFGLCVAVLLSAMGWVTIDVIRLDRQQTEDKAARDAVRERENRISQALWRLDYALAPLLAQENARPYYSYDAFYPMDRAYGRALSRPRTDKPVGETYLPSTLLTQTSPRVLLHFQMPKSGVVTSPQVPVGAFRDEAERQLGIHDQVVAAEAKLRDFERQVNPAGLAAEVPGSELLPPTMINQVLIAQANGTLQFNPWNMISSSIVVTNNGTLITFMIPQTSLNVQPGYGSGAGITSPPVQVPVDLQNGTMNPPAPVGEPQGSSLMGLSGVNSADGGLMNDERQAPGQSESEYGKRGRAYMANTGTGARLPALGGVRQTAMKPVWIGDALLLARRVSTGNEEMIQGAWLDWPAIKAWMKDEIGDLLPDADFEPVKPGDNAGETRMLATIPVKLIAGPTPRSAAATVSNVSAPGAGAGGAFGVSPLTVSLIAAWMCMLFACLAVALLLRGTVALSERRGAFVSAVTHELRTPLTTFRMYSEMLASGMITDEAKRASYLTTLQREANRLSHLVENVLSFARLERGKARSRIETLAIGEVLERVRERLSERAKQAEFELEMDASDATMHTTVQADVSAIEQVLFNLVDNACKYAALASDRRIEVHADADGEGRGGKFRLTVRDHGPGIEADDVRRLFKPFSKSVHEAASSAPGVGLGLALCRRLARDGGGDLTLDRSVHDGAAFVLTLPMVAKRR